MLVDINWILMVKKRLGVINATDLCDIEWRKDGEKFELPDDLVRKSISQGLDNTDLITKKTMAPEVTTSTNVLSDEQLRWLHGVMQNPLHGQDPFEEDNHDSEMRIKIFEATKSLR